MSVEFRSTPSTLRLVRKPARQVVHDGVPSTVPGEAYEFTNGELALEEGADGVEFLREHPENGRLFVEVGNEPGRPEDASEVLGQIVRLTAKGDADAIADIYVAERSSHSRPEVMKACEEAIEALDGRQPDPEPVPEHQKERTRSEPAVGASVPPVENPETAEAPAADEGEDAY